MTVAFRIVYLISLGAIIVLWFLDFDPGSVFRGARPAQDDPALASRLAVIEARLGAVEQSTIRPQPQAPSAPPTGTSLQVIEGRLASLDTRLTELARRPMPPPFDPAPLEEWIKGLEGEIARLAARPVQGFDPEPLENRIAELTEKVDALAARDAPVEATPFDPAPLEERIGELATQVDALARRPQPQPVPPFDAGPLINRIEALTDRVEALSRRTSREPPEPFDPGPLEAQIEELSRQVTALASRPQAPTAEPFDPQPLQDRIEALAAEVSAIPQPEPFDPAPLTLRLDALTERIDLLAARPIPKPTPAFDPAPLEQRIEALAQAIDDIEVPPAFDPSGLIARLEDMQQQVDAETDALAAASTTLAGQVSELDDRIAGLAERPIPEPPPPFDPSPLIARIDALGERIDAIPVPPAFDPSGLEARIGALETAVASRSSDDDFTDLEAQIADLEDRIAALAQQPATPEEAAPAEPEEPQTQAPGPDAVAVIAVEEAWIRLRDGGRVIFEGLLPAGSRFDIPPDLADPNLRAGNAVKVFLAVGDKTYGPVGPRPRLAKNIPVDPDEIAARYPEADPGAAGQ